MSQENRYDAAASGVIASGERGGASLKEKLFGNLVKNLCERVQSKRGKLKGASFMRKKSPEELEYAKIAGKIGILFFGSKECGKQTFLLHLQNLFGETVSVDDFYTPMIHQTIIDGFKAMIDWAKENFFSLQPWESEIQEILQHPSDDELSKSIGICLKKCWISPWAQSAFDYGRVDVLFPLHPLNHYMRRINQICAEGYIPSLQDVLRIPVTYSKEGVRDLDLFIDGLEFRATFLCKNSNSSTKKIARQFEDPPISISALVYLCKLPYLDPLTAKNPAPLEVALKEPLNLFKDYAELDCFQDRPVLIVLTNADLFFSFGREKGSPEEIINDIKKMFKAAWPGDANKIKFQVLSCFSERDILEAFLQLQLLIAHQLSSSGGREKSL